MEPLFPPLPQFSVPHPFRLGVPSYVYPADILPNVESLAPYVDDVELVLFESRETDDRGEREKQTPNIQHQAPPKRFAQASRTPNAQCLTTACPAKPWRSREDRVSNIPSADTIARLAELAHQHDLTYTIHFPIDRHLGSPDAEERRALQKQMLAIMDRTRSLAPFAYILHLEGVTRDSTSARVRAWQNDITELLPALIERAGDPALLCVENLNYPFAWCEPFLDRFGLGVCIDLGHLWVDGEAPRGRPRGIFAEPCEAGNAISPCGKPQGFLAKKGYDADAHLKSYLPRTRVIHLHGVRDERDHLALTTLPPTRLRQTLNSIDKFTGVLTLEIFNYEGVRDSVVYLNQLVQN
jgi:sugar phosphate isomerase/epimerase